jgi:hypothetical protein
VPVGRNILLGWHLALAETVNRVQWYIHFTDGIGCAVDAGRDVLNFVTNYDAMMNCSSGIPPIGGARSRLLWFRSGKGGVRFMVRDVAILGAAVLAFQVACHPAAAAAPPEAHHAHHKVTVASHTAVVAAHPVLVATRTVPRHAKTLVRRVAHVTPERMPAMHVPQEPAVQLPEPIVATDDGAPTSLAYRSDPSAMPADLPATMWATDISALPTPTLPSTPPALSDQESEAGLLANDRGDKTFLMVDKALGKVILFENGQAVYAGPALTGRSLADRIPKGDFTAKFDTLSSTNSKITPAGRYTVARGYDAEVGGPLFDVSEVHGKDWGIAIHQVYLGTPSEHRDKRIHSNNESDKHITFGCINVTPEALALFLHELPERGKIPLYVLPEDASQTTNYLTDHESS